MRIIPIKQRFLQIGALCGLLVLLSACAGSGSQGKVSATPSTPVHSTATTGNPPGSPSPGISFGPQQCPAAVKDSAYWDSLIPTQAGVSQVKSVTCGYLKGVPTLQALVTALYYGTGSILDIYVYDHLASATPSQIFKLQNLYMGDANISGYNTITTAEVDRASSQNARQSGNGYIPDLYREFKWSAGAGTLVQVSFPGIFPDLTRYQAETDQAQVNQGHQPWKLSATQTAQALGVSLLQWHPDATATLISGGGAHDIQAVINLKNATQVTGPGVMLGMARLEGNTNGGIWIVIEVKTSGMALTEPQTGGIIHSITTVAGMGNAFEGVIGKVAVLDHLYTDIGHVTAHGALGNGATTFSSSITAKPTFKNGAQEGLVMLTALSNANGNVAGAIIIKILIQQ